MVVQLYSSCFGLEWIITVFQLIFHIVSFVCNNNEYRLIQLGWNHFVLKFILTYNAIMVIYKLFTSKQYLLTVLKHHMLYGFKVPNFFFLSHVVMCFHHFVDFFYFCFVFKLFIFQCGIIPKDAKKKWRNCHYCNQTLKMIRKTMVKNNDWTN